MLTPISRYYSAMSKSGQISLLFALTYTVFPIWHVRAAPGAVMDKTNAMSAAPKALKSLGRQTTMQDHLGQRELDLFAINIALSERLIESRAANVELEERVKRLEEMMMDIAPGK